MVSNRSAPVRLLPGRKLPPATYVPGGRFPHPGHGGADSAPTAPARSEKLQDEGAAWADCEAYRWGVDLFNHGYYWEAHEAWEAVWLAAGRTGPVADFCKGLIHLAAAGVKAREGRSRGVERHARRARQLLEAIASQRRDPQRPLLGLRLSELIAWADQIRRDPEALIDTRDRPVVVVMPFVLQPVGRTSVRHP